MVLSLAACVVENEESSTQELRGALSTTRLPDFGWMMWSDRGRVALSGLDERSGELRVRASYSFSDHWRAVGVAGDKLLWQRTDIDLLSLWTVDENGGYRTHVYLTPPRGFQAVSIAVVDDGECRRASEGQQYIVSFYREGWFPLYWRLDNQGAVLQSGWIFQYEWGFSLQDFRRDGTGLWAMLWASEHGEAILIKVEIDDSRRRLDTVTFRVDGRGDHPAPGDGFRATSVQMIRDLESDSWSNGILWSRRDGLATIDVLDPLGELYDSIGLSYPGHREHWSAASFSGISGERACDSIGSSPDSCPAVCSSNSECAVDACGDNTQCVNGMCIAPSELTCPAPCSSDSECAVDACGDNTQCVDGMCSAPSEEACPAMCRSDSECAVDACGSNTQCVSGRCSVPRGW